MERSKDLTQSRSATLLKRLGTAAACLSLAGCGVSLTGSTAVHSVGPNPIPKTYTLSKDELNNLDKNPMYSDKGIDTIINYGPSGELLGYEFPSNETAKNNELIAAGNIYAADLGLSDGFVKVRYTDQTKALVGQYVIENTIG